MKEIVSLLLTTTCLAVAGLGIYFFSYKTHDDNDSTQKFNRKRSGGSGKKIVDVEEQNHDSYNDYDDETIDDHDDDYNHDNKSDDVVYDDNDNTNYIKSSFKPKNISKKSAAKTKKNKNKFTSSKKRYYY